MYTLFHSVLFLICLAVYLAGSIISVRLSKRHSRQIDRKISILDMIISFIASWLWVYFIIRLMNEHKHTLKLNREILDRDRKKQTKQSY